MNSPGIQRLILEHDGPLDGIENMRRDAALLEHAEQGQPGGRVYAWDGLWVSLGRFQSPEKDLVDPNAVRWVTRPTGGKAVIHGHDVTVSLAFPLKTLAITDPRSIKEVYREVIRPIVAALRACGVPAALAEETRFSNRGLRTADCFAFSSANDIVNEDTGLKICGCALRLTQTSVLLQASIPNGPPLRNPAEIVVNAKFAPTFAWDSRSFYQALKNSLCNNNTGGD